MSERNDQLSTLITEQFAELRWRRDIEDRLANWTIAICSGTLAGAVALVEFASPPLFLVFGIFASALIVGVARRVLDKIESENEVYRSIGQSIGFIVAVDHSLSPTDKSKPYVGEGIGKIGSGDGFRRTTEIIRFATGCTALGVLVIAVLNYAWSENKEPNQPPQPTTVSSADSRG